MYEGSVTYYGGLALWIGGLIIVTFGIIFIIADVVSRKGRTTFTDDFYE